MPETARPRILIVEDDEDIAEVLCYNLERAGFQVECLDRGDLAYERLRQRPPDLLLLDLMLPGIDGLDLTRMVRRDPETASLPILMLTARSDEIDRIVGLELGADDYLPKPFSPREVVLRVRAILRRTTGTVAHSRAADKLQVGTIVLDVPAHRVEIEGRDRRFTATEFRLLKTLMERSGRVQSRETLLTDVWDYPGHVASRTVDTHIKRLRHKLGSEGQRIETVVGVGYRFRA